MLKLNKKSGYSILEVLCAISILSIMLSGILMLDLNNLKLKKYNNEIIRYTYILDTLKKEILFNCTYEDIKNITENNKKYISGEYLTIENIKKLKLNQLFNEDVKLDDTYLEMNIVDDTAFKIELNIHLMLKSKKDIIKCEFYKGKYI